MRGDDAERIAVRNAAVARSDLRVQPQQPTGLFRQSWGRCRQRTVEGIGVPGEVVEADVEAR